MNTNDGRSMGSFRVHWKWFLIPSPLSYLYHPNFMCLERSSTAVGWWCWRHWWCWWRGSLDAHVPPFWVICPFLYQKNLFILNFFDEIITYFWNNFKWISSIKGYSNVLCENIVSRMSRGSYKYMVLLKYRLPTVWNKYILNKNITKSISARQLLCFL